MAGPTVSPSVAERLEQAVEVTLRYWDDFVAAHPEVNTIPPSAGAGWAALIAAGAYFLGSIPTTPTRDRVQVLRDIIDHALLELKQPTNPPQTHRQSVRLIQGALAELRRLGVVGAPSDAAGALPSPQVVASQELARLRQSTALLVGWQREHHTRVHGRLADAEAQEAGAEQAVAAATASTAHQHAQALQVIVDHLLPQLRLKLVELVTVERQLRHQADAELRDDLRERAVQLQERIGDVVRWLRTEALPAVRELVQTETALRVKGDKVLTRGLSEEVEARTDADEALMTQLAPVTAWMGGFGLHTTEKVRRNEDILDELGNLDWSMLLAFAGVPALMALVGRLMPPILSEGVGALAGLESAAARALGSFE